MSTAVAKAKYIRSTPKKLREIAKAVKGLPAQTAMDRLRLLGSKGAMLIAKHIGSAMANGRQSGSLDPMKARVQSIVIGKGPMFKRYRAVSRGMAHEVRKRTAHIHIVLGEK